MPEINAWSPVSGSATNNAAPPDGWPEGMAFGSVNNSARENMAVLARYYQDTRGDLTAGGTANVLTLAPSGTYTALFDGMNFRFRAANTNTGAATLQVDALGAEAIVTADGSALPAGAIVAGGVYDISRDDANSRWVLLGAVDGLNNATLRLSATTAASLASTAHALQIGADASANLALDTAGAQARDNGVAVALELQRSGGNISHGPVTGENTVHTPTGVQALNNGVAAPYVMQAAGGSVQLGGLLLAVGSITGASLSTAGAVAGATGSFNSLAASGLIESTGGNVEAAVDVVAGGDVTATGAVAGATAAFGATVLTGNLTATNIFASDEVGGAGNVHLALHHGNSQSALGAGNVGTLDAVDALNCLITTGSGTTDVGLPSVSAGNFVWISTHNNGGAVTVTVSGGSITGSGTVADETLALFMAYENSGDWARVV